MGRGPVAGPTRRSGCLKLSRSILSACLTTVASGLVLGGCSVSATRIDPQAAAAPPADKVVLVHGLWRGKSAMWLLAHRLEEAGFEVVRVDYASFTATPEEIVAEVSAQIDACCGTASRPVHFVGHSMGGLAIRSYLVDGRVPRPGRVVLIGSPNSGTPIVDEHGDAWWMALAGPTARALGTGPDSFPNALPEPDYPVGVIAGFWAGPFGLDFVAGDDDGLVPVESTKVPGMTDFVLVDAGHAALRYREEVADQVVAFLRHGRFVHE